MAGKGEEARHKRRRIHLDVVESVALSQSKEGSASLRHPIERKHPARDLNQGLEPRYRGRTQGRFRPPRRLSSQPHKEASTSGSQEEQSADDKSLLCSNKGTIKNFSVLKSSQNDSDPFDLDSEELEKEMVEQSSDQSIHLLSKLGGFTSAAGVQQNSASCSFSPTGSSPGKNSRRGAGLNRPRKKEWVKDANQSSITSFLSSPWTASSSSTRASGSCGVQNQTSVSSDRGNRLEALTSYPEEKVAYGSPSKMFSPIKKVSDNVYVISDESSPSCSPDRASGRSVTHTGQGKSVAKTLFPPFSTQASSTRRSSSTSLKQASGRGKRSSASSKKSNSVAGTCGRKTGKSQKNWSQRTLASVSSTLSLIDVDFDAADDKDFIDVSASVPPVRQEVEVGKTYGLLNDSKVTVTRENYFEKLPFDVVENIFCGLPMLDLCLNVNRVCLAWNDIISSPKVGLHTLV